MTSRRLAPALALATLLIATAACNIEGGLPGPSTSAPSGSTTVAPGTTQPSTTEAPATTASPTTTVAPEEEDGGFPVEALAIGLGVLLLFLLIGWLMGRSRRSSQAPPVAPAAGPPTYKDFAREGYADARWLLDNLTEELAVWRGNALFEGRTGSEDAAASALAAHWAQVDTRHDQATRQLYQAEASAPDQTTSATVRTAIDALNATRAAVDARAEARFASRGIGEGDQFAMAQAADRERLAASNLATARQELNDALIRLSAVS